MDEDEAYISKDLDKNEKLQRQNSFN